MKVILRVLAVTIVVAMVACGGGKSGDFESNLQIESTFKQDHDYSTYKTWDWVSYANTETGSEAFDNAEFKLELAGYIEKELTDRGLQWSGAGPDLKIGFYAAREYGVTDEELAELHEGYNMGISSDVPRSEPYNRGTLVLFVFDSKTGEMLWQASAQARVDMDDNADIGTRRDRIRLAVRKMLNEMPRKRTESQTQ